VTFEGSFFIHGQNASTQSTRQRLFPPHLKLSRRLSCVLHAIVDLWLLVLVCPGSPSWAQYRYDTWTADSGLPQNIIRGICQTPDGYLWIATLDGLARFDGVHFTVFSKSNSVGIVSNRFGAMVEGTKGDLWLYSEGGGITRYHQGSFHPLGAAEGLPDNTVQGVAGDENGNVWVLSSETILQWNEADGKFADITPKELKMRYSSFRWENAGFWGWDEKGLHSFHNGRFITYPLPASLPGRSIWTAALDQNGTIWLETFDGKHLTIVDGKAANQPADATTSYVDRHGHSWSMLVGHQLARSVDYSDSGLAVPVSFSQLHEDREGNIWLGTEGHGLYRLQKQSIHTYSKEQGLGERNIYPIYQDRSGDIWIGDWGSGLSRFKAGKFINYTTSDGLPNKLVTALYEDRAGELWVGTHGGLSIFAHGRFHKPTGPVLPDGAVVQAIGQDKNGTLWFGTSAGLVSYKDEVTKVLTAHDGLAADDVRVIVESRAGELWIGGYGGVTRIHDGRLTNWTEHNGLPSNSVRSIYEDSDGVVWVGTYDNGLGRFENDKWTRYNTHDGLFSNGVFQILEDSYGNLWISCNRGIYRLNKKELNDLAAGKNNAITAIAYGNVDGMLNVECNGGLWPDGIKTRDGKMWFPTQDGVAVVDPESVRSNPQPPPVMIQSALIDQVPVPVSEALRITPGKENLEIQYTALSFIKSDQIRFRYMLEGLDTNWVHPGPRRTAYYSHLPPGSYVFRVIAGNSDGVWNTEGKTLAVIVLAPFYRTWWFLTCLLLAAAVLISALAHYRVQQLQQARVAQHAFSQQLIASQESERKRIAAELHDSLGQRLVVINNLALFFLRGPDKSTKSDEQTQTIEEISSEASLAIEETRSISYNLRPFQLDRLGLVKAIEGLIRTVSKASGIHFTSEIADINDLFPEDLRINFYRIVQEALNNIMKHAQATEGGVRIAHDKGRVILTIHDNGRGFAPGNRASQTGLGGFGLTGMTERASLLGGSLKMRSDPVHGTVMTVEIPLGRDARG
jgi:signal transduction histidine kinase/ligand-binding sensor domain-containing protein